MRRIRRGAGLFCEMHSAIYANGHQLSGAALFALASQLELDVAELRDALQQGDYASKVEADFLSGVRSGVNGTPCSFVNGLRHDGSYAAADLAAAITLSNRGDAPRRSPFACEMEP